MTSQGRPLSPGLSPRGGSRFFPPPAASAPAGCHSLTVRSPFRRGLQALKEPLPLVPRLLCTQVPAASRSGVNFRGREGPAGVSRRAQTVPPAASTACKARRLNATASGIWQNKTGIFSFPLPDKKLGHLLGFASRAALWGRCYILVKIKGERWHLRRILGPDERPHEFEALVALEGDLGLLPSTYKAHTHPCSQNIRTHKANKYLKN